MRQLVPGFLRWPVMWVGLVFLLGVVARYNYTFKLHPPTQRVVSDMGLYVRLARELRSKPDFPSVPAAVTHPLGFPRLLSVALAPDGSWGRAIQLQFLFSALVPLAIGLLGWAAFGRKTGLAAVAAASAYFPFIDYGALFLAEIHFIFWLALTFAAFFVAIKARVRWHAVLSALGGGVALSMATSMKAVAIPAAVMFLCAVSLGAILGLRGAARRQRLGHLALLGAVVLLGAMPLLTKMAKVCTTANRGSFCIVGNKAGSDFLLGHYGRYGAIKWGFDADHNYFEFGSPASLLRRLEEKAEVPFAMTDGAANTAEAWRWIRQNPGQAIVLSLNHVYDAFFGIAAWPTSEPGSDNWWFLGHLFQFLFVVFLFLPVVVSLARLWRGGGARGLLTSTTAYALAPVAALIVTVMIATGEVRYRIPFDIFFIAVVCARLVGEMDSSVDPGPATK